MSSYLQSIHALYALHYARRTKVCPNCGANFCDITKRNLMKACDAPCQHAMMVAKRRANGSFAWTESQKQKARESVKATYASREVFTQEHREKFRETMKRNWQEGRIDTSNHWARSPEGRKRISQSKKGKKLGPQPNMSLAAQRRLRTRREALYTSAHGGYRPDLQAYFRSNWEANFARVLDFECRKWIYEAQTFQLSSSLSYTPDFFVPEEQVFYELKGRMDDKSKRQLELMAVIHPEVIVHVIDGVKYAELSVRYKNLIATWEGK